MIRRLLAILGRRTMLTFGVVTFLVGALLATVNITSRYALKMYVDDQLRRTPWDLAVYQQGAVNGDRSLYTHVMKTPGVLRVESLAFLRARFPESGEVEVQIDRKPFTTPWLCVLAASDPSILPPALGLALARGNADGSSSRGGVLSLVGPEYAMGNAFLALQGARDMSLQVHVANQPRLIFNTPLKAVVRLDRDELNRWLMDQTGSVSYIPYIGAILLMPYDWDVLTKFDQVATGFVPPELLGVADSDAGHIQMAEYAPEIVYLAQIDRASLISGWDIPGSLAHVRALNDALHRRAVETASVPTEVFTGQPAHSHEVGESDEDDNKFLTNFVVDSTTEVLLDRMQSIARLIGVVSLLVSLPLLWMAWVLAANLAGLLMLNERHKFGLMRLRGISGELMGRALLISVTLGGIVGGALGLIAGSVVPLMIYERGGLPLDVLLDGRQLAMFAGFMIVSVALALLVSRRLVRYASTISPLEASARVSGSEAAKASLAFGPLQQLALLVGGYVLFGWIFEFAISDTPGFGWFRLADRLLDFLGLPLFLYGVATLLASNRHRIQRVMAPVLKPIGGALGPFALRHMSAKPHRTVAFLLIVALMSSVSLYPIITSRSFEDKAIRGARVQLGTDWQVLFNAPDLVSTDQLTGNAASQLAALRPQIDTLVSGLRRVEGVTDATYMIETVLPSFYLPGYGLRGVPMYLFASSDAYRNTVYAEPPVGLSADFQDIIARTGRGEVAVSPPVADFWRLEPDTPVLLGLDAERRAIAAPTAGVLAFLPGIPPKSVSDRQGYVQARVDYLNYLFNSNAYLGASADNAGIGAMQILVPRIIVLLRTTPTVDPEAFPKALAKATPFTPLEIHSLNQEIGKVGSDMYISLALANMRIYLLGGIGLALVAILSVAIANYSEDRRTLALLRIRGASPVAMWRFVVAMLLSPALVGLALGAGSAVLAGFGLANYVWRLREIRTVVQLLPTHLVIAPLTIWVVVLLAGLLVGVASGFSWWVFRHTANESMRQS